MYRSLLIVGVTLTHLFSAALPASAAPAVPGSLPNIALADAMAMAWARTAMAAALPHRQTAADAQARVAGAWTPGPPSIGLSTFNDRLQEGSGRQEWEVEVATPLWLPGQRDAQRTLSQARQALLSAKAAVQRLEVAGQVRRAWWHLATTRAALDVALRRVQDAQALQADVKHRWQAGDLARTDANAADAEMRVAQAEWLDAQQEDRRALAAWQALVGSAAPLAIVAERLPSEPAALDAHPALAAADAAIDAARAHLRVAERSRSDAPELAVRWVRERGNGAERYANALGVQLRIPLSSAPRSNAEMSGVRAELTEAEVERHLLREQLRLDAEQAGRDLEAAEQALVLARSRVALTAETSALLQKSFTLGEADLATLLRARAAAFLADAALARQAIEHSAAVSRILQSHGVLK
jgi:cobalt-zinc-cadmium efflux system outer membrane protein